MLRRLAMTTAARIPSPFGYRLLLRGGNLVAVGFLALACALASWRGAPLAAVIPVAFVVLVVWLVFSVVRALRRASVLVDTILREELDSRS
jgi:hypothetical protein